mmetsp:Transcript_46207/g.80805  ORF Transcript_46207/g.80805 Transcript_46207/m.80805 type:complete len:97 (-) Transcript_46207:49-339(-)
MRRLYMMATKAKTAAGAQTLVSKKRCVGRKQACMTGKASAAKTATNATSSFVPAKNATSGPEAREMVSASGGRKTRRTNEAWPTAKCLWSLAQSPS